MENLAYWKLQKLITKHQKSEMFTFIVTNANDVIEFDGDSDLKNFDVEGVYAIISLVQKDRHHLYKAYFRRLFHF